MAKKSKKTTEKLSTGNLSMEELHARVREVQREIFDARMQQATGQLKSVSSIWRMRKDLARVKTALSSKEKRS